MKSDAPATLLAVGYDVVLLRTRAAVLRSAGFQVVLAQGSDQAKMAAGYFAFQAALLCHTLKPEEQHALAIDLGYCSRQEMGIIKLQREHCQPASLIVSVRRLVDRSAAAYRVRDVAPIYKLAQVSG